MKKICWEKNVFPLCEGFQKRDDGRTTVTPVVLKNTVSTPAQRVSLDIGVVKKY